MKSLYLRVWLTVVAVLALFALGSGWLAQRHVTQERDRMAVQAGDRIRALGELIGQALPEAHESEDQQAQALRVWSERLRMPLALDDARGRRIASTPAFDRRVSEGRGPSPLALVLDDGRTLWMWRGPRLNGERRGPAGEGADAPAAAHSPAFAPLAPLTGWALWDPRRSGGSLVVVLVLLFLAVAVGAYPVVRRLTRRLEALQSGVERFGQGALGHRVHDEGRDEVARLAAAFNQAAQRIEALVQSHSRLVANASHELRSPLARLKVALSLMDAASDPASRARLQLEITQNLRELDALIEELLLSSRLQAQTMSPSESSASLDLLALVAEEAARSGAELQPAQAVPVIRGEERLIRRAVRNLLDNAQRYGQGRVEVAVLTQAPETATGPGPSMVSGSAPASRPWVEVQVLDRGPGVPLAESQRIFEPFYRLPGHAESEGGVGLGLALVRQIAQHHGGTAEVRPRAGGGSCFVLRLPYA